MACNRSIFGIIIGYTNIILYIGYAICAMISNKCGSAVGLVVGSLIMIVMTGLLIMGIQKRRQILMLPWLIFSGIGFVINIFYSTYAMIVNMIAAHQASVAIGWFIGTLLGLGLSALILWLIYTLYKDIERENIEKTSRNPHQTGYVC